MNVYICINLRVLAVSLTPAFACRWWCQAGVEVAEAGRWVEAVRRPADRTRGLQGANAAPSP